MLRPIVALVGIFILTGWGDRELSWPYAGATPDAPIAVPSNSYRSIATGIKSYRPVEPLPWGDTNRRVAPPGAAPAEPQQQQLQASPVAPATPPAMAPMPGMQH